MARGDRDLAKEQLWRGLLQEWKLSEKSVRAFCAERGLDETKFYCWRRTIAKRDGSYTPSERAGKSSDQAPAFVPVEVKAPVAAATLEVVVSSGRVIRVPAEFDAAALRRLLMVLEAPSC